VEWGRHVKALVQGTRALSQKRRTKPTRAEPRWGGERQIMDCTKTNASSLNNEKKDDKPTKKAEDRTEKTGGPKLENAKKLLLLLMRGGRSAK